MTRVNAHLLILFPIKSINISRLQEEYGSIKAVSEAQGRTHETFYDVPIYLQEENAVIPDEGDVKFKEKVKKVIDGLLPMIRRDVE